MTDLCAETVKHTTGVRFTWKRSRGSFFVGHVPQNYKNGLEAHALTYSSPLKCFPNTKQCRSRTVKSRHLFPSGSLTLQFTTHSFTKIGRCHGKRRPVQSRPPPSANSSCSSCNAQSQPSTDYVYQDEQFAQQRYSSVGRELNIRRDAKDHSSSIERLRERRSLLCSATAGSGWRKHCS